MPLLDRSATLAPVHHSLRRCRFAGTRHPDGLHADQRPAKVNRPVCPCRLAQERKRGEPCRLPTIAERGEGRAASAPRPKGAPRSVPYRKRPLRDLRTLLFEGRAWRRSCGSDAYWPVLAGLGVMAIPPRLAARPEGLGTHHASGQAAVISHAVARFRAAEAGNTRLRCEQV